MVSLTLLERLSASILKRAGIQPYNGMQGANILDESINDREALLIEEDSQRPMIGFEKPQRIRTLMTKRWRMSIRMGEDWSELYDLESDPDENVNLWNDPAYAKQKAELHEIMLRKTIELQDRAPLPSFRA